MAEKDGDKETRNGIKGVETDSNCSPEEQHPRRTPRPSPW